MPTGLPTVAPEPSGLSTGGEGSGLPESGIKAAQEVSEKEVTRMRTYERPTLTRAGNFTKVTGLGGSGPPDAVSKFQLL